MPLQNRVTPTGEIIAHPARGTLIGNRGILHDSERRLGVARWRHPHWIYCQLAFKERKRPVMAPRCWTELFFLDEATALAAGHRPCCYCRRGDFLRFQDGWRKAFGVAEAKAATMDRALHKQRVESRSRRQIRFEAHLGDLPDSAFVLLGDAPMLWRAGQLHPWSPHGYGPPRPPVAGPVRVLTPAPTIAVLAAGFRLEHDAAAARAGLH